MNVSRQLNGKQKRQIAVITAGAIALYVVIRLLPTGTNLAHVDFQVPGGNSIQFCDPTNPAFIPVVAVKSPVTMTLATDVPPAPGRRMHVILTLRTASGKPIGPVDLLVTHTKLLHLMVVDPSLRDYQHIHPVPGQAPGEWEADLTPQRAGRYLAFADFTPAATARGLYASAEFSVPGMPDIPPATDNWVYEADGLRFTLAPDAPFRARAVVNLRLTVESVVGRRPVPLEPVMGAYAHLVAFDAPSKWVCPHPSPAGRSRLAPGPIPAAADLQGADSAIGSLCDLEPDQGWRPGALRTVLVRGRSVRGHTEGLTDRSPYPRHRRNNRPCFWHFAAVGGTIPPRGPNHHLSASDRGGR